MEGPRRASPGESFERGGGRRGSGQSCHELGPGRPSSPPRISEPGGRCGERGRGGEGRGGREEEGGGEEKPATTLTFFICSGLGTKGNSDELSPPLSPGRAGISLSQLCHTTFSAVRPHKSVQSASGTLTREVSLQSATKWGRGEWGLWSYYLSTMLRLPRPWEDGGAIRWRSLAVVSPFPNPRVPTFVLKELAQIVLFVYFS